MKTSKKELSTTQHPTSFDEIIFQGRNLEYGAFYLRKAYHIRLLQAFLFTSLLIATIAILLFILNHNQHAPVIIDIPKTGILETEVYKPDIPKAIPEVPTDKLRKISIFSPPQVIDAESTETTTDAPIFEPDIQPGDNDLNVQNIATVIPVIDEPEPAFIVVDEPARFQDGDANEFRRWIIKNLHFPADALANGTGGRVYIQFSVDKKGQVCDIQVLNKIHESLANEVVHAIQLSPLWIPAKNNGNPVKQLFSIFITFDISD